MRASSALLLTVTLVLLGGCRWMNDDKGIFVNKTDDYIDVQENEPLVIPEGLDTDRVQDPFPVPSITSRLRPEYYPSSPPRPNAIYGSDTRDEVRIQRLGQRLWLVVPEPPTTVWPKVRQFLAENGVALEWEAPNRGRMDTAWLEITDEAYRDVVRQTVRDGKAEADLEGGRDRLRLRIEPGLRERATEVHVRHENDGFAPPGPEELVDLRGTPSHLGNVEQELLNELGAYIAARVAEQTVSMVALDIGSGVKSYLDIDGGGDPVLRLRLDRERAWATVGQSLNRADIDVADADEATGVYRITVPEDLDMEAEERGFFRRLFSFGGRDTRDLQLRLTPADNGDFLLTALADDGSAIDREFGQQVLVLIREYAS
ncbi:MAG: outer membrane protein assembly factor BamC [Pseudomonadales bacterium]